MRLTALLLALVGILAAQPDRSAEYTEGARNGRYWLRMQDTSRVDFIIGFIEALHATAPDLPSSPYYCGPGVTVGELEKALNQFFDDPANLAIPIRDAIRIFVLKIRGAPPETLSREIAALRGAARR